MENEAYFIGVDVGTQGVRVVLLNLKGSLLYDDGYVFKLSEASRQEQSPDEWWNGCCELIKKMVVALRDRVNLQAIKSIGVTSTSGTVIPLNANNEPLHNAIMYSDKRSEPQSIVAAEAAATYHGKGFCAFNSSCGLAKMLWFAQTFPGKNAQLAKWIHAADYITGKLSGNWAVTDYTNAFKSGYDVHAYTWPEYISEHLGIKKESLPEVVASGTVIGTLTPTQAKLFGLSDKVQITAGITDGCASQIAAGAVKPGDWNTTIGTTLVIKGVVQQEIRDPEGRIYNHKHAMEGWWMPGGASNIGADWVSAQFDQGEIPQLNNSAESLIPTGKIVYPLMQKGERFPMVAPQAEGFGGNDLSKEEKFAASMEGVAFIERYAFELLEGLSDEKVMKVYTAGGASNSDVWLKIRSAVLNKNIVKMKHVSGGVGAAILAASKTHFKNIVDAVNQLAVVEKEIVPDLELVAKYEMQYQAFLTELVNRNIITQKEIYA
jgi:sugar (pentulose or hexulose) kinase